MVLLSKKVHDKCRNQAHKLHQPAPSTSTGSSVPGCLAVTAVAEAEPPRPPHSPCGVVFTLSLGLKPLLGHYGMVARRGHGPLGHETSRLAAVRTSAESESRLIMTGIGV